MTRMLFALLRPNRASATVELAIILPAMILIVAGIVEFGRIFQVYVATNRLATQFAFSWASCPDDSKSYCGTELSLYTDSNKISNVVPQLTLSGISLSMMEFYVVDAGIVSAPVILYSRAFYNGTPGAPVSVTDLAAGSALAASYTTKTQQVGSTQYVVVVIAKYNHTLSFFNTIMNPFLGSYLTPSYSVVQIKNQTS